MAKRKGSRKASAKKKLRYAFIGAGGIAGAHMRYLKDMEDVEMVAMADISKPGMETKAEQFGIDGIFTDYRKMLSTVKPDAVSVCTPNGAHAEASISASNAGAHVMVEKPMAMSAAEAKKMITAANRKRRKLVIGFQHRYDPRTKFIKDAVDSGRMGKVIYGRIQALRRRGIPNWGVFGRKDLQGGGPLIDIGVHALEMTHFAMGSPTPVSASGSIFTYLGDRKSDVVSQWPNWDHKADGGWGVHLRAPDFQADGGWGEGGDWDETEEEELVEEEVEFEEEAEEEIAEVGEEEVAADVAEFIAELVSVYEAQDTESFERLVSEEYSEIRASDEDEERLDYYALIDAVRNEVDVAGAFRIKHSIRKFGSDENGVRVAIQWQMVFEDARSGRTLVRKGVTGLGLAHFEGWQLITQRKQPLFGAITSESLEGREKPGRRERRKERGR